MSKARVVIENITPQVDCGRFAVKRVVGEDRRRRGGRVRRRSRHRELRAAVPSPGAGPLDRRQHDPAAATIAGPRASCPPQTGPLSVHGAGLGRSPGHLEARPGPEAGRRAGRQRRSAARGPARAAGHRPGNRRPVRTRLRLEVERERARFSSWYEMFPRSAGEAGSARHVEGRRGAAALRRVDGLRHPVPAADPSHRHHGAQGTEQPPRRRAAGSRQSVGHRCRGGWPQERSIRSWERSTDFRELVAKARELGIEIALDIAFQASPDHPYVKEHPEWFLKRPDGTIQYAENPPKKYQDIYPFDFECDAVARLWDELKSVFDFWIGQGVRVFRVDNPHTKPFALWQWIISGGEAQTSRRAVPGRGVHAAEGDVPPGQGRLHAVLHLFLLAQHQAGAHPVLHRAQQPPVSDFFRPNLWPNTPDILPEFLQFGGRPAFALRLVLAATLGASYGIYGPAFELLEHEAARAGQRGVSATARSTSCATGIWSAPTACGT